MNFLHSFKAEKATLPSKMTLSDFKPGQNGESPRKLNPLRPSNSVSKSAVSSTVANLLGPDADPNQFSATQLFSSMTLDRPQSEKVTGRSLLNNLYYRWASYKVGSLVAYKATRPPPIRVRQWLLIRPQNPKFWSKVIEIRGRSKIREILLIYRWIIDIQLNPLV